MTIQEIDEIWYYKEGVYVPGGEIIIAKEAEQTYHFEINSRKITEIKGHIMRLTYHSREEFDADINIINLKNGLYDWKNNILKNHSPRYLIYQPKVYRVRQERETTTIWKISESGDISKKY